MADFGQTKEVHGSQHSQSGTLTWAAPEQNDSHYDPLRADMWGAGCIVYFLLTSLNPFVDDNYTRESPISAEKAVEKHTFPGWPRLHLPRFQEHPTRRIPGDQIIVRDASNEANHFLMNLIVRDPLIRMSVHRALQHPWICKTTPLESALRAGDLTLSRLLACHDPRYGQVWDDSPPDDVRQIILRFAAANGHRHIVAAALPTIPTQWTLAAQVPGWPNIPHSLIGAAQNGHLDIVKDILLFNRVAAGNVSGEILVKALVAALQAGHHHVVSLLVRRVPSDLLFTSSIRKDVVSYGDRSIMAAIVEPYIEFWRHLPPWPKSSRSFRRMVLAVARAGRIDNLQFLISHLPPWPLAIESEVLMMAARSGHDHILQLLLERCPAELRTDPLLLPNLLNRAAAGGHIAAVEYLVKCGALPAREAIAAAVSRNYRAVVQLLLKALIADGSPRSIDIARSTITTAIAHCDLSLLQWHNSPSLTHVSDIHKAALHGDLAVVAFLLTQDWPTRDTHAAALVGAAEGGHTDIIEYLYTQGLDITNPEPWCRAAQNGHSSVLQLLLRYGETNRATMTDAVGLAVSAGHIGVVVLLLSRGAVWNGSCEPLMGTVVAAFASGVARPEIGAAASRRYF